MGLLGRSLVLGLGRGQRRTWHTHTWIRFTRWQDPVKERRTFEGYEEAAKVHTDPHTGVFLQMDDPGRAIRKPYEDQTREEVGAFKFDFHAWRIEWQYMDLSDGAQSRYQRYQDFLVAQYDQRFLGERQLALGPDLAAAHFLLARGGAVKFLGDGKWYRADGRGRFSLPGRRMAGLHVEAIDASATALRYEGLENLLDLEHCRMLSLAGCRHIGDWALDRVAAQFGASLEMLDVSGCEKVTAKGLSGLHSLKGLRELRVGERSGSSQWCPLEEAKAAAALEDAVPGLRVDGVDWEAAKEETERRRALLEHPAVVEDARGSHWLCDEDGELHLLRSDALRDRPVVDDDDLPLFLSTVPRDVPNLPLSDLQQIDALVDGRLRHSLVGSPSGPSRRDDTQTLLLHAAKRAAFDRVPLHPFLQPDDPAKALPPPPDHHSLPTSDHPALAIDSKS